MAKFNKTASGEQIVRAAFDGCITINPGGKMGIGAVARCNDQIVYRHSAAFHESKNNTNNVAEYLALELLIDHFLTYEPNKFWFQIQGDSEFVIKQMNGLHKIKTGNSFKAYYEHAVRCDDKLKMLRQQNQVRIDFVPRAYNREADEISREALHARNYKPAAVTVMPYGELDRLYEWLINDNREPAFTAFTAGKLRNVAREIEYRIGVIK